MPENSINPTSTKMFIEAAQSAEVIALQLAQNQEIVKQIKAKYSNNLPSHIITCARGSSDHAATFAKYVFETRLGILTASLAPSISSVYKKKINLYGALCLAISQSGKSPDILAVVQSAKSQNADVIALVNDISSPLAEKCDILFPLCAGKENSVAATKSFIASLVAVLQIGRALDENAFSDTKLETLPQLLAQSFECDFSPLVNALIKAEGLYTIGRGPGFGIANEAALKFQETCGLHAQAFSAAEVKHGPMALIKDDFPILVFRQNDESAPSVDALVKDLAKSTKQIFVIGAQIEGAYALPYIPASPLVELVLQIQSFYKAINSLAIIRGFDPDNPQSLKKVTETI